MIRWGGRNRDGQLTLEDRRHIRRSGCNNSERGWAAGGVGSVPHRRRVTVVLLVDVVDETLGIPVGEHTTTAGEHVRGGITWNGDEST